MGEHAEPVDELIRRQPPKRRARRLTELDVDTRRSLVERGYTARTIEWLVESGALDD